MTNNLRKMEKPTKSMLVYASDWQKEQSFRMMPVSQDCPFNEVIYDPTTKVLAIVSKDKKEKPHMLPRLDDKGKLIPIKPKTADEAASVAAHLRDCGA